MIVYPSFMLFMHFRDGEGGSCVFSVPS
jgi:hypothetical protein